MTLDFVDNALAMQQHRHHPLGFQRQILGPLLFPSGSDSQPRFPFEFFLSITMRTRRAHGDPWKSSE